LSRYTFEIDHLVTTTIYEDDPYSREESQLVWFIIDKKRGYYEPIGLAYEADTAEKIVDALNAQRLANSNNNSNILELFSDPD
jgi:hypothetical protein